MACVLLPVGLLLVALRAAEGSQLMTGAYFRGDYGKPRNYTEQALMVCNAYAYSKPLHIYNIRSQHRITGKEPLAYKECGDYHVWLREGDQLDFRTASSPVEDDVKEREAGEHSVGIFRAWGLPKTRASLLLVPHRHGDLNTIAFESHVFRELQNSQLAVVDTYMGESTAQIRIDDNRAGQIFPYGFRRPGHSEELKYNSVVVLNPGSYRLVLSNSTGDDLSVTNLEVDGNRRKFVVMRVGVDQEVHFKVGNATELPQEIFVHGQPKEEVKSSAAPHGLLAAGAVSSLGLLLALRSA